MKDQTNLVGKLDTNTKEEINALEQALKEKYESNKDSGSSKPAAKTEVSA